MKKAILLLIVLIFAAGCGGEKPEEPSAVSQFAHTEGATLSDRHNQRIRAFLDSELFANFPVWGIGTEAGNRIGISIKRVDEEADELIEEMLEFIAQEILANRELAAMDIDLGVFDFQTAGPIRRYPVEDYEKTQPATLQLTDITPYGLTFYFTNESEYEFIYGRGYRLYVREGDMWRFINPWGRITDDILGHIEPFSESKPRTIDWTWFFEGNGLGAGEYRISKVIWLSNGRNNFTISQRFTIE